MTLMDFVVIALSSIIVVCVITIAVLKSSRHKRMALCKCDPELKQPAPVLSPVDREHFGREWQHVEARFAEDPRNAVVEADRVAEQLLSACGYSVPHVEAASSASLKPNGNSTASVGAEPRFAAAQQPVAVRSYREAHEIALKQAHGQAHGKELRRAMLDYRIVFDDLVGEQEKSDEQVDEREAVHARTAG